MSYAQIEDIEAITQIKDKKGRILSQGRDRYRKKWQHISNRDFEWLKKKGVLVINK